MIPELVGRLPYQFAQQAERRTCCFIEPRNALVKQYQKLLQENAELEFTEPGAQGDCPDRANQ